MKQKNITKQNKKCDCEIIIIDPDKEDFFKYFFGAINEIFGHIKQLSNQMTKIRLIKIIKINSIRLLRLEFKSETMIKSKAIKCITKKILPLSQ